MGWTVNTEAGTFALPEKNIQELLTLLAIVATKFHIGRKELERLVGRPRFMYHTVPGVVVHLYYIQRS